ncbi:MAG: hypothetical protein H0U67_12260 [Gemmatimonadetes bacterium]|nr:hypothetical protein [Gemmatimonadota bacterium]
MHPKLRRHRHDLGRGLATALLLLLIATAAKPLAAQESSICVISGTEMVQVPVMIDPASGDTLLATGQRFRSVYSDTLPPYAGSALWYKEEEPIYVSGFMFSRFGPTQAWAPGKLEVAGEFEGVPVFVEPEVHMPPEVIHVPVAIGCEMQAYRMEQPMATAGPEDDEIPQFRPWPPPRPSSRITLPRRHFIDSSAPTRLRQVADRIRTAFQSAGYEHVAHYAVPGGFALVSRIEQINNDGSPRSEPDRWVDTYIPPEIRSVSDLVKAFLNPPVGRFRMIVFTITTSLYAQSSESVSSAEAEQWLDDGWDDIPASIADLPFTNAYNVNALVYEFERSNAAESLAFRSRGRLGVQSHLTRNGMWSELTR